MKRTVLTLAILAGFSQAAVAQAASHDSLVVSTPVDSTDVVLAPGYVRVISGGEWSGSGVTVEGPYSNLISVEAGGVANLTGAEFTNDVAGQAYRNATALLANGAGATANLTDSQISLLAHNETANYTETAAVLAKNGGEVNLVGGSVSASGKKRTSALLAMSNGTINADGTEIVTTEDFGHVVRAYSTGAEGKEAVINLDNAVVRSEGSDYALGIQSINVGALVTVSDSQITTLGRASSGAEVYNGAHFATERSSITTAGNEAHGVRAYGGAQGAGTAFVDDVRILTTGENAHGVTAGDDFEPTAGRVRIQASSVITEGQGSTALNAAHGGSIEAQDTAVVARGENAAAASVRAGGSMDLKDSSLISEKADGIVLTGDSTLRIKRTSVEAAKASLVSNLTAAGQTQNIEIGEGSEVVKNDGTLLRVARADVGMDGVVNLTLGAGSVSRGDVIDADGLDDKGVRAAGGKTNFVVEDGASWQGRQQGLADITVGAGGSIVNENGAPIAGNVTGGENSRLVFLSDASIGGTLLVHPGNTTDFHQNANIGGDLTVGGSNINFGGDARIGGSIAAGAAEFHFSRGGETVIGGDVTLGYDSIITGGTTAAPIQVQGDMYVHGDSILGGNVNVAGTLRGGAGVLRPGNSIGTQTFGSITDMASKYVVEVNRKGEADLVVAKTGDIDVSRTELSVGQENGDGGFRLNKDYTVLVAESGKIIGDFRSAGLDSSFDDTLVGLAPVKIGENDVKVRLNIDGAKVADVKQSLTKNQSATLDGVVSVVGDNVSADAAVLGKNLVGDLSQLSGEIHASTQSSMLYASNQVRQTLSDRMAQSSKAKDATPVWAQVQGRSFSLKGDDNAGKVKVDSSNIMIGADKALSGGWRVGGAVGYADSSIKAQDGVSGKSDVQSYTAAIYGGKSWERKDGQLDFLAGAAYTHSDVDTKRNVSVGGNQSLKTDYSVKSTQLFTELGYGFNISPNTQVGPFAGLAWVNQKSGSFKEKGGDAALQGKSSKDSLFTTTLGVRGKTAFDVKGVKATAYAGLGWRHASGDVDTKRKMSFVAGDGEGFSIAGAPIAKDAAVLNLGVGVQVGKNSTLGVGYSGQFGKGQSDNSGMISLKIAF